MVATFAIKNSHTLWRREAKNFKKSKERVTLLSCSNAAGTCRLSVE